MTVFDKFPLQLAKRRLALFGKNGGNRLALHPLDLLVAIDKLEIHLLGHLPAHGTFARAHEADKVEIGCCLSHPLSSNTHRGARRCKFRLRPLLSKSLPVKPWKFTLFNSRETHTLGQVMSAPSYPDPVRHDYTFASDNTAGLAPEALAAFNAANESNVPSYGDDSVDPERAKELIRGIFATDCEVFFVFNGTAANSLAISTTLCRSYHSVICHDVAHVATDECGAPEFFSGGTKLIPVSSPNAKLTPVDVERIALKRTDVHHPESRRIVPHPVHRMGHTLYRG